jgi:hypothetical protein
MAKQYQVVTTINLIIPIMCFSASASFGAGLVLAVISVASLKKARPGPETFFACIPLIFSIQQCTEGFVWLSLSDPSFAFMKTAATVIFLFIAQVVWPFMVPLSISLLEKNEKRKMALKILVGVGVLVSVYLGFCLFTYHVEAKIIGQHISYEQIYPLSLGRYGGLFYIIATIGPPFFSSVKRMWILGTAILISYIITAIFYNDYIVSVWCFFASVISISVLVILYEINKPEKISSLQVPLNPA